MFGLTYAAMIYCMRHVGEAHLNPIVTVAMLLTRRVSVIRCLLFIVAQFLGAIIGAGLAVAVTAPQLRAGTIRAAFLMPTNILITKITINNDITTKMKHVMTNYNDKLMTNKFNKNIIIYLSPLSFKTESPCINTLHKEHA